MIIGLYHQPGGFCRAQPIGGSQQYDLGAADLQPVFGANTQLGIWLPLSMVLIVAVSVAIALLLRYGNRHRDPVR